MWTINDVEIRPARFEDYDALTEALGDHEFFADRLTRQNNGHGALLTAWLGARPIGGLYVWLERAEEPEIREHLPGVPLLNHLEVVPRWHNQGVGSRLVAAAERILRELRHHRVALAVRVDNVNAARLYRRLGYQRWSHPPVLCAYEVTLPDGTRKTDRESCDVFVKRLGGFTP